MTKVHYSVPIRNEKMLHHGMGEGGKTKYILFQILTVSIL